MKLKLIKKVLEAKGTKSFFWEPEKTVGYLPGQYYYFTLPALKYPDPKGATRHITISSSPTEGNLLRLTTRIREESGYKKTLDGLPIGAEIEGEGPNGTFVLDEKEGGINVFLAGGIGITPFRSMIKYAIDRNLKTPMHLIYSNSNEDEIAFKKELEGWGKKYEFFKMESVITSKVGRIDEAMLKKLLDAWKLNRADCIFWVVGPPAFIDAMEQVLGKIKITSDRIRSEKFTGY